MYLETERLTLSNLTDRDIDALKSLLQDKEVMYAYEHAFGDEEVAAWYERQVERYRSYGYGLLGVRLKNTDTFIGQAGITLQTVRGAKVPEIGYLLKKRYWHQGYATECAAALKKFAFEKLHLRSVYSIIRENNAASRRVAERIGMRKACRILKYYYGMDMPHIVYFVSKNTI